MDKLSLVINKSQRSDVIEHVKVFLQFMFVLGFTLGKSKEAVRLCKKKTKSMTSMSCYLVLCCITSNVTASFSHPGWAKVVVKL